MINRLKDTFIDTDFLIVSTPLNMRLIKKNKLEKPNAPIFIRNKESMFYILFLNDQQFNQYEFEPCLVINNTSEINEIAGYLMQVNYVLVKNDLDEFIGYISSSKLLSELIAQNNEMAAYMNTILNTIEGSCIVVNKHKIVMHWAKGAEEIFNLKREEILGKSITNFFNEDRLEILNTLKGTSVYQLRHHAREDLVVLINSNPIYLDDQIIGAVVYETDITSQIRLNNKLYSTSEKLFSLEKQVQKGNIHSNPFIHIKGSSSALLKTFEISKKIASTSANVLIYGESGVGKELFAKSIHDLREKNNAPYVAINCGAISSSLFESEIFGYEKGAFSGADVKGKKGKVELANGGTLFLDEIGEMPLEMQVKFLRVLQEKQFYAVGGTKEISVDCRVIAATNRDLKTLVMEGKFREDLYYRLNVVNFVVPPLRERHEDIIELTHYFLYENSIKYKRPIHGISEEVMSALLQHSWPGNVRELQNAIERLVIFSENSELYIEDLPFETGKIIRNNSSKVLSERMDEYEREVILSELKKHNGNKIACAKTLGISRATLYNRMNKLRINTIKSC